MGEPSFRELQERLAKQTPVTFRVPPPGWTHPTAELYEHIAEACRRYNVPEADYLPLKPGAELQKVVEVEIRIKVPFDTENDPSAEQWEADVKREAAAAARTKRKELLAEIAGFKRFFPRLNSGQPVIRSRRRSRTREIPAALRADIFVLKYFLCKSASQIREKLNLPESLNRQAIESTAQEIQKRIGAVSKSGRPRRKLRRSAL